MLVKGEMAFVSSPSKCVPSSSVTSVYGPNIGMRKSLPAGLRQTCVSGRHPVLLHIVGSSQVAAGSFIASKPTHSSRNTVLNANCGGAKHNQKRLGILKGTSSQQGIVSTDCLRDSHVTPSAASASVASVVESSRKEAGEQFDWEKCWYPIGESQHAAATIRRSYNLDRNFQNSVV